MYVVVARLPREETIRETQPRIQSRSPSASPLKTPDFGPTPGTRSFSLPGGSPQTLPFLLVFRLSLIFDNPVFPLRFYLLTLLPMLCYLDSKLQDDPDIEDVTVEPLKCSCSYCGAELQDDDCASWKETPDAEGVCPECGHLSSYCWNDLDGRADWFNWANISTDRHGCLYFNVSVADPRGSDLTFILYVDRNDQAYKVVLPDGGLSYLKPKDELKERVLAYVYS